MKTSHSRYRHGQTGTKIHNKWRWMMKRCYQKTASNYCVYGGRGVVVCDDWHLFENFMSWALLNGYDDNLTIDRLCSDDSYSPDNCRWITLFDNISRSSTRDNHGKNKSIKLSFDDVDSVFRYRERGLTQRAIASIFGVSQSAISLIIKGAKNA